MIGAEEQMTGANMRTRRLRVLGHMSRARGDFFIDVANKRGLVNGYFGLLLLSANARQNTTNPKKKTLGKQKLKVQAPSHNHYVHNITVMLLGT